jgi:putative nucleotidyltransferase with HDIG domain
MEKAQRLVRGITTLPTIPEISLRVSNLLESPQVELKEVADLILSDQILTARVIKVVNSPLFKPLHEITSLRHALIYLGFRRINEIVFTCSLIKTFEAENPDFDIRTFWQHSFGVGIMARKMAHLLSFPDIEKVYTSGIVHNIGKVFMWTYLKQDWARIIRIVKEKTCNFIDAEKMTMGTTHCEIGLCLAKQWNFPQEYCDVIAHHHFPANTPRNQVLVSLINLSDIFYSVCEGLKEDQFWTSFDLNNEPSWVIIKSAIPQLADFDVERFSFEIEEQMPEIHKLVNDLFVK